MFLKMNQSGSGRCFVTENKKVKDQMIKFIEGYSKNNESGWWHWCLLKLPIKNQVLDDCLSKYRL